MARIKDSICWALSDSVSLTPTIDSNDLKKIGPIWGSWRTWRAYQTDNVICHDQVKAAELIQRDFQSRCNFFLPESVHVSLDRPSGVKIYAGEFVHDVIRQEEIVTLHLAATTSDIVIMLGWDLSKFEPVGDKLRNNQAQHHRNMIRQAFAIYDKVQWVIADHEGELDPEIAKLPNLVIDSLSGVLELAGS